MQQVITEKQARQITGGRKPLVPVVYEEAVRALAACLSLDDAKEWDHKADALAAWAKIYRDDKVGRQARALKLEAHRRMGQLAFELRPKKIINAGPGTEGGRLPGPRALLIEKGLRPPDADAALLLAKLDKQRMEALRNGKRIPSPSHFRTLEGRHASKSAAWREFINSGLYHTRTTMRRFSPRDLAAKIPAGERLDAVAMVREVADWCDEFLQAAKA